MKHGLILQGILFSVFFGSFGLIQKNQKIKIFQSSNRTKAPAPLAEKSSHRTLPDFICRKINDSTGCMYQF